MRYLITGVAGFIGSHLLKALLEQGHEVIGVDNFLTGRHENIAPYMNDFKFVAGDIRDIELCRRVCKGVDHVLHQAALGSVPHSIEDPLTTHEINTNGTLNMLIGAREADVDSFVFAASSAYFGDTDELPKHDNMAPRPLSPYAVTKITCEQYLSVFAHTYGMNTVGLRYFNIFGPRQRPDGPYAAVIPKFLDILLRLETPVIFGDGGQTRDFTYIDNCVQANIQAGLHAEKARGQTMNIGTGVQVSLLELYNHICNHLGIDRPPIHGPERAGDIRHSVADISLARELIEYDPKVGIEEGLKHTVEYFKNQHVF